MKKITPYYATISPDPEYWGAEYKREYYNAVMAALERMGFEVAQVEHQGTTSETVILSRGGYDAHAFDDYDSFDWFALWCAMDSGHDDANAVYLAFTKPSREKEVPNESH